MASEVTVGDFELLYRSTATDLFGYVRRRTSGDAEDLVAEVYAIAWRRRADLPAPMLRRAWLFGVARMLLAADGRVHGAHLEAVRDLGRNATGGAEALSDDQENGDRAAVVRRAMARLSPQEQEVLRLVEWERLTPAELAVALGLRPGTARVRLHRARQALASDPELQAIVGVRPNRPRERSSTVLPAGVAEG